MKSSFCIDLQRFMLIPTKFPLSLYVPYIIYIVCVLCMRSFNCLFNHVIYMTCDM